jgi:hypothetical protein
MRSISNKITHAGPLLQYVVETESTNTVDNNSPETGNTFLLECYVQNGMKFPSLPEDLINNHKSLFLVEFESYFLKY